MEQFEDEETNPEEIEEEIRLRKELKEELKSAKTLERRREIEKLLQELPDVKQGAPNAVNESKASSSNEPATAAIKPALQLPMRTTTTSSDDKEVKAD